MSIARAFTTRRARQDRDSESGSGINVASAVDNFLGRSKTTKALSNHGSIRHKISGPVELTHTTNMLSYNAPNIGATPALAPAAMTPSPSSSSVASSAGPKSDDEASESGETNASTPPTSPDTPFPRDSGAVDAAFKRATSPEPNHLSCYFLPPKASGVAAPASGLGINAVLENQLAAAQNATAPAPLIPQRAPSHTKKPYEGLSGRHRSVSRMSESRSISLSSKGSFSFSRSSSSSTSTSVASSVGVSAKPVISAPLAVASSVPLAMSSSMQPMQPVPPTRSPSRSSLPHSHKKEYSEAHPFGQELAKVSELVEEFKEDAIDAILEEDTPAPPSTNPLYMEEEREMARLGLVKFTAESYLADVQSLMGSFFSSHPAQVQQPAMAWI